MCEASLRITPRGGGNRDESESVTESVAQPNNKFCEHTHTWKHPSFHPPHTIMDKLGQLSLDKLSLDKVKNMVGEV